MGRLGRAGGVLLTLLMLLVGLFAFPVPALAAPTSVHRGPIPDSVRAAAQAVRSERVALGSSYVVAQAAAVKCHSGGLNPLSGDALPVLRSASRPILRSSRHVTRRSWRRTRPRPPSESTRVVLLEQLRT